MAIREFQSIDTTNLVTEHHLLRDGRRLAYTRYGYQGGTPVYYFHGCPDSRLEGIPSDRPAAATEFEVFAFDRPGCSQSSYIQNYRMLDRPIDAIDFADAMHHDRELILGNENMTSFFRMLVQESFAQGS